MIKNLHFRINQIHTKFQGIKKKVGNTRFLISVFFLLGICSIFSSANNLQSKIVGYHADESHTVLLTLESFYTGKVRGLTVGESSRWLTRLVFPVALYYMNSNMGGVLGVVPWSYPGAGYLRKNLTSMKAVASDANLQDFMFALKLGVNTLVILSFTFAAFFISRSYGLIYGLGYFTLSLSSKYVIETLNILYTEGTFFIIFNIIICLSLVKKISIYRLYFWLPLIFSLSVFTKATGLLFIFPIIAILYANDKKMFSFLKIELFLFLTLVFSLIVCMHAPSFIKLLNDTLSNVYHLKTGHGITQPSGMFQFKNIFQYMAPWSYISLLSIPYLIHQWKKNTAFVSTIIFTLLLMVTSIVGVSYFHPRNLNTPSVIGIFLFIVFAYSLSKNSFFTFKQENRVIVSLFVAISLLSSFALSSYANYKSISIEPLISQTTKCKSIGTINVKYKKENVAKVLPIPSFFKLSRDKIKFLKRTLRHDCIIANRINKNKQYTNYLLPMHFNLKDRVGNYFLYVKKVKK